MVSCSSLLIDCRLICHLSNMPSVQCSVVRCHNGTHRLDSCKKKHFVTNTTPSNVQVHVYVTHLFNCSLQKGKMPTHVKYGLVGRMQQQIRTGNLDHMIGFVPYTLKMDSQLKKIHTLNKKWVIDSLQMWFQGTIINDNCNSNNNDNKWIQFSWHSNRMSRWYSSQHSETQKVSGPEALVQEKSILQHVHPALVEHDYAKISGCDCAQEHCVPCYKNNVKLKKWRSI
jgi:hypothetical protein